MNGQRSAVRQISLLSLVGLGLLGISLFAPDAVPHSGPFYTVATQTTWDKLLDLPAAWASVKIILCSLGLVLVIESTGTVLSLLNLKTLAVAVFFLQVMPCLGLICGGYYLAKSLL